MTYEPTFITNERASSFLLQEERIRHAPADEMIRAMYLGRTAWSAGKTAMNLKIRCCYATLRDDLAATIAWQSLLNHPVFKFHFLSIKPVFASIGPQSGNTYLDAMMHLAFLHKHWVRPLELWEPTSSEPKGVFASLVRSLLATYSVPSFMDACWFEGFSDSGIAHRNWFLHIASGQNIRTADKPVRLTKMAAHRFLQAPSHYSIIGALRYGQVIGFGGSESLAEIIAETKLGSILPDEEFWESVIHFFVNCPKLDPGRVGAIIDYLYDRKFGDFQPDDSSNFGDAIEPTLTMKGRKLEPLWERVESWHEALAREEKRGKASWEPSGLIPLHVSEADASQKMQHWSITELCDSQALQKEGSEMRHCVFTYRAGCLKGKTSIWSVRFRPDDGVKNTRLLTVEVDNRRRAIVQVKGKCNKRLSSFPGKERMKTAGLMLRRWAQERKLGIACGM